MSEDFTVSSGSIVIKNISGSDYVVEELAGQILTNNEELDLIGEGKYESWDAVNYLITSLTTTKLYQDIQASKIEIVLNQPPSVESNDS